MGLSEESVERAAPAALRNAARRTAPAAEL
jgi:hypothetical protein